ncbi:MAG: amidohydrolase family protein [Burkholderiaceae bacterium]
MEIVDSHHHLWDLELNSYPWLKPDDHDRGWGDTSALKKTYSVASLLEDAAGAGVELVKSVHVQANFDPTRPVDETRWLESVADDPASRGLPNAIVGFADLSSPALQSVLEAHCKASRFRGIRQVLNRHPNPTHNRAPRDFLEDDAWCRGFASLARYGLSFDAQIYHHQAASLIRLARANPNVPVVVDHTGLPLERDEANLSAWREAIAALAALPHVMIKLSGFGMLDRNWGAESIRPFVLHCIECFGPERAMFGSNFPVDRLMASYGKVWSAFDEVTCDFSASERSALFRTSAERFYRI